jgi:hypothetical protein
MCSLHDDEGNVQLNVSMQAPDTIPAPKINLVPFVPQHRKHPIHAVQILGPDFNGRDFDGMPFSDYPGWLRKVLQDNTLRITNRRQTDYAEFTLDVEDGRAWHLTPGDYMVYVGGKVSAMKELVFETYFTISKTPLDEIKAPESV